MKDGDHELEKMVDTSFDSLKYSGKYHQLKPENQQHITWYYNGVKDWNERIEIYYRNFEDSQRIYPPTIEKLEEYHKSISEAKPDIERRLNEELEALKKQQST